MKKEMRSNKEIREAVELLRKLNSDDEVRRIYEDEEWAAFVEYADRAANRDAGRAEGRLEIINNMLKNGATKEQIAKMLNIEVEEIEKMLVAS